MRSFYFAENVQNTEFIEIYDYVNETDTAVDNICKHVIDDLLNLTCSCVDKNFFLSKLNAISGEFLLLFVLLLKKGILLK